MSRLYHNEALSALPVKNHNIDFQWNPKQYSGYGVILEGEIECQSRHSIVAGSEKHRYYVLHVKGTRAHRRKFDSSGKEIEPNFSETEKVRQGYLHSSYKTVAKGETDLLSTDQLIKTLACPDVDRLLSSDRLPQTVGLWVDEAQVETIELTKGDRIRVKTRADCPFVESLARLDAQSSSVSNYAGGDQVGGSWTDQIMAAKSNVTQPLPQDTVEGVDDDEWDD